MRRVRRPEAEPSVLARYRQDNPTDAAADGANASAAWDRFRDYDTGKTVRAALVAAQGGLCAYCEYRLTGDDGAVDVLFQQIEHVIPKRAGRGRALDWTNLVLCCGGGTYERTGDPVKHLPGPNRSCGSAKGDRELPPGCDPRDFPPSPRLVDVDLEGLVTANETACRSAGIDPADLDRALNDVLNLNCERLRSARSKIVTNLLELVANSAPELLVPFAESRLKPDNAGHLVSFWTTERQYLEPGSSVWLADNHPD